MEIIIDLSKYKAKPNKSIREHTDDLIHNLEYLEELGYVKDKDLFNIVRIACEYHDYGKVNREFQYRIKNQTKFNTDKEIAHNVLSLYFIDREKFEIDEDYFRVCFAVAFHHYYCDVFEVFQDVKVEKLIKDLLVEFKADTYELEIDFCTELEGIMGDEKAVLIKGFVNKCDFSASGGTVIEYKNDFLNDSLDGLLNSWKEENKDSDWNDLQYFCKENKEENIIVVAQTGMGKTEAGLLWIGDNKGFFILPLKTAINAIYNRISSGIVTENIEQKAALLHSDSLSYYTNHADGERDILEYHRTSKQLSIPLNVATLDQIFDFVLKCHGYEVKLATLSYSKVVIDEIQMYSADLLAYLVYGIKTIIKFGGKVAILTATLAPFVKDFLAKEGCNFKEATFVNNLKRHNIKTYDSKIDSSLIFDKYVENKKKNISNKILVVCNTIKKAQEVYKELELKGINKSEINIFHSKFIKKERAEKEDEILKFGKTENIGSGIWISTQIVEASLDIDFDYLFAELSDINGLFQRLGRCNRKGKKSVCEYNCYIFLNVDDGILTRNEKGFIDRDIYNLSRSAIKNIDGVLSEHEKIEIINKTLTTENIKGSKYWAEYDKFLEQIKEVTPYQFDKRDIKFRNIVSFTLMPNCIYKTNQAEIDGIFDELEFMVSELKELNNKDMEKKEKEKKINEMKLRKVILIDRVKLFTVSVSQFDMEYLGKYLLIREFEISKFESIPVIDCKYDQLGFSRDSTRKEKDLDDRCF